MLLRNVKVIKDKDRLRTDWGRLTRHDSYTGNPGLDPGRKESMKGENWGNWLETDETDRSQ